MKRQTVRHLVLFVIVCVSIGGFGLLASGQDRQALKIGDNIPEIETFSADGIPVSFLPPKNKLMLVQFWNPDDSGTTASVKETITLYRRFHKQGLNVVSACTGGTEGSLLAFSERWQIPWPQVLVEAVDDDRLTALSQSVEVPSNLLIDSKGTILATNLKRAEGRRTIAKHLAVSLDDLPISAEPMPIQQQSGAPRSRGKADTKKLFGTYKERKEAEPCKKNLRKIGIAITKYKQDHDGKMPEWLSDLHPKYIEDKNVFLCPANPVQASWGNLEDPKIDTSYLYDFAPVDDGSGRIYKDWKTEQLTQFGDRVVVARCLNHAPKYPALTYGGEIIFTMLVWEAEVPRGHTLADRDAKVRKQFREIAVALDQYKKEHGDVPDEIENLVPKYVKDQSLLTDPVSKKPFPYQFSASQTGSLGTMKEESTAHLEIFGDYVPIVRTTSALNDGYHINLGYGGEIWPSKKDWQNDLSEVPVITPPVTVPAVTDPAVSASAPAVKKLDPVDPNDPDLKKRIAGAVVGKDIRISKILDVIAAQTGLTIVLEDGIDPPVTFQLENPTLKEFFDEALSPAGLVCSKRPDDSFYIWYDKTLQAKAQSTKKSGGSMLVQSQVFRTKMDLQTLSNALEAFFIDNDCYPVLLEDAITIDGAGFLKDSKIFKLDEPVSYIGRFPGDPFDSEDDGYRYNSDGKTWWILASNGPDGEATLDLSLYNPEKEFGKDELQPYTYDSNKGIKSKGDIFKTGP